MDLSLRRCLVQGDEHISGSAHLGGAVVAALVFARLKHWI